MFKVLENGTAPTRGSKYSACVDLYASEDVTIGAGETKMISLGVCIEEQFYLKYLLKNEYMTSKSEYQERLGDEWTMHVTKEIKHFMASHYLQLMLRSSLGKKGLVIPNGVGVIDLDYKDEIKMIIHYTLSKFDIDRKIINTHESFKDEPHINEDSFKINKGDKIAHITLLNHKSYLFGIESDIERSGGFGSTDGKE